MKRLSTIYSALLLAILIGPLQVAAISEVDQHAVDFDTAYYQEGGGDCTFSSGQADASVSQQSPNFPPEAKRQLTSVLSKINALKSQYQQGEQATGVDWRIWAAIHHMEGDNRPGTSELDGLPLGTHAADSNNTPTTLVDSIKMAAQIDGGNLQAAYGINIKNVKTADDIMKLMVVHNRGGSYKAAGKPPQDSPYVYNDFDAAHVNMTYPSIPGETLAGRTETRVGAFPVYVALAGGAIGGGDCSSAAAGSVLQVAEAELAKHVTESTPGCNCGPEIDLYTDKNNQPWCADFVSWVYKTAGSPFTGGVSGGWRIPAAIGIVNWLKANGTWVDNRGGGGQPQPGDAIYFNYSGGATGGANDHIGIVEKVQGNTLTTIEGNHGNGVGEATYTNYRSDPTLVGWGRQR